MADKCKSCIGKLEYKTSLPWRYCKYNNEKYFGRDETKMTQDHYIEANKYESVEVL